MKYYKRLKIYKSNSGNCTFDPETMKAYSYRWWAFVAVIEGKVVFNNYRYSAMTTKHQWKVRSLLNELDIKIDLELPIPDGLPGTYGRYGQESKQTNLGLQDLIEQAEEYLCYEILDKKVRAQESYQRQKERKQKLAIMTAKPVELRVV